MAVVEGDRKKTKLAFSTAWQPIFLGERERERERGLVRLLILKEKCVGKGIK